MNSKLDVEKVAVDESLAIKTIQENMRLYLKDLKMMHYILDTNHGGVREDKQLEDKIYACINQTLALLEGICDVEEELQSIETDFNQDELDFMIKEIKELPNEELGIEMV